MQKAICFGKGGSVVNFRRFFRIQFYRYVISKLIFLLFAMILFFQFSGWLIIYLDSDYNRQIVFKKNQLVELKNKFEIAKKENREKDIAYYKKEIEDLESKIKEMELIKKYSGKKEFIQKKIEGLKSSIDFHKSNNNLKEAAQLSVELKYYELLLKKGIYKPKTLIAVENVWVSNTIGFRWMDMFFVFGIIVLFIVTLFCSDIAKGYIKMLFPSYRIKREKLYIYTFMYEVVVFLLLFALSTIVFSILIYVLFKRETSIDLPYFTNYGLQLWGESVIISPEKTTFDSCIIGFVKLFIVYSLITTMIIALFQTLYSIISNDYFVLAVIAFLKVINYILPKIGVDKRFLLINPLSYTDGWGIVTKSISLDYNVMIESSVFYLLVIVGYTIFFMVIGLAMFRKKSFY